MICRNKNTNIDYNYSFIGDDVELSNMKENFKISYNDWLNDYFIIDKWNKL